MDENHIFFFESVLVLMCIFCVCVLIIRGVLYDIPINIITFIYRVNNP